MIANALNKHPQFKGSILFAPFQNGCVVRAGDVALRLPDCDLTSRGNPFWSKPARGPPDWWTTSIIQAVSHDLSLNTRSHIGHPNVKGWLLGRWIKWLCMMSAAQTMGMSTNDCPKESNRGKLVLLDIKVSDHPTLSRHKQRVMITYEWLLKPLKSRGNSHINSRRLRRE